MFVTSGTHNKLKDRLKSAELYLESFKIEHNRLITRWNGLVGRINHLGGEDFMDGSKPHPSAKGSQQFTDSELKSLLQMIHPDKQGASEVSVRMKQKINSLRK